MAGDLKRIIVGLIMFALFGAIVLLIATEMGTNYGKNANEIGGGSLNPDDFQGSVENLSVNSETYRRKFESGNIDNVDDPTGIWGTIKKFVDLITTPFTLLGRVLENILGVPSWITNILLGILSLSLIIAFYFAIRSGT